MAPTVEKYLRFRTFAWTAVLNVGVSGCSFTMMKTAPADPVKRTVVAAERCTSNVVNPVFDTLAAGVGVANIVISANAAPGDVSWYGVEMNHKLGTVLGASQLAVFGASAVFGYIQAARCAKLRGEFADDPDFEREKRKPIRHETYAEQKAREAREESESESEPEARPDPEAAPTDDDLFHYD